MTGRTMEMLRKQNRIKRSDFARFARLTYNTVYQWERCPDRQPPGYGVQLLLSYIQKVKAMRQEAENAANTTA